MTVLAATNITHAYGNDVVLENCSLRVEAGERIGIVGRNGTGKSTLLKIMAGMITPDSGTVTVQRGVNAGYLHQDPMLDPDVTLRDAAEEAFAELHALHVEMQGLYEQMEGAEGEPLERLLRRQAQLEARIETAGGYAIDHRIDAVLHGLGFTDAQFAVPVAGLSGGQRGRLALARLLLDDPDVLLLDEPTNHLDLDGRVWLETFLTEQFKGAVVMVAHDRYLLDRVVSRIAEVEHGRVIDYPGSYSAFRKIRGERRLTQQRAYEKQQQRFKKEEAFIRKYKAGQRAKQARGRESRLERAREETLERPMELATMKLQLPRAPRSGEIVATARGISKSYENEDGSTTVLFDDLDVKIGRSERWGIIGPNGAGKTTLVRCLLGELKPDSGSCQLGARVEIGYYRQTHEHADPDMPVFRYLQDLIRRENPDATLSEQEARDLAGAFLFSGDDQSKQVGDLSGGERSRAVLAGLLASAKNVLVLDEPTNHLDIPSAERLEDALALEGGFDGTVLLISHDRAIIDAACDHLLVLDGTGGARVFLGNYSEWRNQQDQPPETRSVRPTPKLPPPPAPRPKAREKNRYSWMQTDQIEARIEELEGEIRRVDAALGDPEVWTDAVRAATLTDERAELAAQLQPLEEEWLKRLE